MTVNYDSFMWKSVTGVRKKWGCSDYRCGDFRRGNWRRGGLGYGHRGSGDWERGGTKFTTVSMEADCSSSLASPSC